MAEKATLIMHSGDLDKVYSALIIGNGALAMGMEVSMYFTFWGLQRLEKGNLEGAPLSRKNMLGLGKWVMQRKMKKANVRSLEELLQDFVELGGKIFACDMTMDVMGIDKDDLREEVITEYCSVGTFIKEAKESEITLFI
ncbi:MAG: NAD(FAD)-dependent dehydrogenase [Candidatus Korarchaeota archaeon]|nr:NAD(FAD)-dependent dehydrogenase [Candidatus Korarchaeota archaeon]NIU83426.1 NAD(FAD)-dependent dehydrogenase [Candidatus Thorarchaeota archaeon]NIW13698.1 NAD(FAD)-dependent dehydrogenase [Candidatus Thorarchaeota archaeon]NIW51797.1 NAD(FAD)-dependent dehydrogenase [Candidatus Korarchaeota archaeon]